MTVDHQKPLEMLANSLLALPVKDTRTLVAIVGPPASGKSTITRDLAKLLTNEGRPTAIVAMDGFHLDNKILQARALLHRKGAPES